MSFHRKYEVDDIEDFLNKKMSLQDLSFNRESFDFNGEVEEVKKIDAEIRRRKLNNINNTPDDKDELLNIILNDEELKK